MREGRVLARSNVKYVINGEYSRQIILFTEHPPFCPVTPVRRRTAAYTAKNPASPHHHRHLSLISSTLICFIGQVFFVVMPTFPPVPEFPRPNISPQLSRTDNCCSRTQRCCWAFVTWLPVTIVYGATLWAVYVNVYVISLSFAKGAKGISSSIQVLTAQGCYSLVLG